jgi:hypothetical protein
MGTPDDLASELIRARPDERSDVHGLGSILCEILTTRHGQPAPGLDGAGRRGRRPCGLQGYSFREVI